MLIPHYFYMGDPPSLIDVATGSAILHNWNQLHEEQKAYINTMFSVIVLGGQVGTDKPH